jgi:carnitine 3-dehydrogenase
VDRLRDLGQSSCFPFRRRVAIMQRPISLGCFHSVSSMACFKILIDIKLTTMWDKIWHIVRDKISKQDIYSPAVKTVAVVGCGVIGSSWATYYLAKGFDVIATDPAPGAEECLRKMIAEFWPAVERVGLGQGASSERLTFEKDAAKAVQKADFIQENGPERIEIKRELIAQLDGAAPIGTLIVTSSSGILVSEIQDAAKHPERVLLGHPFNPPHLIPLVEVVGGKLTSSEAVQRALAFYTAIGKKPILIHREMKGHVANRLQAALWREAFYLVDQRCRLGGGD